MNVPEEYELTSLFEVKPTRLDKSDVPFFYNETTYEIKNSSGELITFKIQPAYGEIDIVVTKEKEEIINLSFRNINSLSILADTKTESRIMLTKSNAIVKINFKPIFKIQYANTIE